LRPALDEPVPCNAMFRMAKGTGAPARPPQEPPEEQSSTWVRRVHEIHAKRMTPEMRQEMQRRVERSRQSEMNSRKCKALRGSATRSNALAREGLRQMAQASASTPAAFAGVTERWGEAQMRSEARQARAWNRLSVVPAGAVRAAAEESDEDEDEAIQEAAAIMGPGDVAIMSAEAAGAGAAGAAAAQASSDALLQQLRREPAETSECAANFQLYEGYGQQVEKIRKLLFDFCEESLQSVPAAIAADMRRQLGGVDSQETMGIPDDDRVWFVYHMMRVAEKNNRGMASILDGFQRRLEYLASNDQTECPVCLEPFAEAGSGAAEVLSCCHKICQQCWGQWKRVTRGRPFCPLCKHDEFLNVVATEAAA